MSWTNTMKEISSEFDQINHYLLGSYMKETILEMPNVLENLFKQFVRMVNVRQADILDEDGFKYIGKRELSPYERLMAIRNAKQKYLRVVPLNKTNKRVLVYEFEYLSEKMSITVELPYIEQGHILVNGVEYWTMFGIMDKGGLHAMPNKLSLQVMRAPLTFLRSNLLKLTTVEGEILHESSIEARIHQGARSKSAVKANPPIIIHELSTKGLLSTLDYYGVADDIAVVREFDESGEYSHIAIPDTEIYIRMNRSTINPTTPEDLPKSLRVIRIAIQLHRIFTTNKDFEYEELFELPYYVMTIGHWVSSSKANKGLMYKNAADFIKMNETLIDPVWQARHAEIGIVYDDLSGLCLYMFDNINRLLAGNRENEVDMSNRTLANAESILSAIIIEFNKRVFHAINTRTPNKPIDLSRLTYMQSFDSAIIFSKLFVGSPERFIDNELAITGKRITILTPIGVRDDKTSGNKMPMSLMLKHYSYLYVCSAFTFPAGSPVVSGSINPCLKITRSGAILAPDCINELKNVYN